MNEVRQHTTSTPREHPMAILLISNASGSVTATVNVSPAPVLPPAGQMTTPSR